MKISRKRLHAQLVPYVGKKAARRLIAGLTKWNMNTKNEKDELRVALHRSTRLRDIRLLQMFCGTLILSPIQRVILGNNRETYELER